MGLFNKVLGELLNRGPKQLGLPKGEQTRSMYYMPIEHNKEIMLFDVEKLSTIQYDNGYFADLMMAKVVKGNPKDTIIFGEADYIGFELPQGRDINDDIANVVMRQWHQGGDEYIGGLTFEGNNCFRRYVTENVKNMFLEKVQERRIEEIRQMHDGNGTNSKRKKFLQRIDGRKSSREDKNAKQKRIKSATIEQAPPPYRMQGDKIYFDYDAINVKTGDFLRINKVDKVAKNENGIYIYTAYIENTNVRNSSRVLDFTKEPSGFPVCFELPRRFEDIVSDGNVEEIRQVLELLSSERNFENGEELKYIGAIDKYGRVSRNAISSSPDIQAKIEEMKREFAERMKRQKERGGLAE